MNPTGLHAPVGNLTQDKSLHFPGKQFLLDALLHWGKHLLLELEALASDRNLICLQLLESSPLLFGHFLERNSAPVCQSIKPGSQVRFDLVWMIVVETSLPHLPLVVAQGGLHPRIFVYKRVLRIVVICFQLIWFEDLLDRLTCTAACLCQILNFDSDRKCGIKRVSKQCMIIGCLLSRREASKDFHVAFAQTYLCGTIVCRKLRRSAGIKGRHPKAIAVDKLLLINSWQCLVRSHAGMHGIVVGGDILETLLAHTLRNKLLSRLNCLHELAGRQAELLGTESGGSLCLRSTCA